MGRKSAATQGGSTAATKVTMPRGNPVRSSSGISSLLKFALYGFAVAALAILVTDNSYPNIPRKLMFDAAYYTVKLPMQLREVLGASDSGISSGAQAIELLLSTSPPINWTDVASVRRMFRDGFGAMLNSYILPTVQTINITSTLSVELQAPETVSHSKVTHLIYLHGGAYLVGHPSIYRTFLRELISLSKDSHLQVWALDYRLAPEHPLPAAVEDVLVLYDHLINNVNVSPDQIFIGGDSAGGGLALLSLIAIRDSNRKQPSGGILIAPWVDLSEAFAFENATKDQILKTSLADAAALATKTLSHHHLSRKNPIYSPLYANLKGLPNLFIVVGTSDSIVGDSRELNKQATKQGTHVVYREWKRMQHIFPVFFAYIPEGVKAIQEILDFVHSITH